MKDVSAVGIDTAKHTFYVMGFSACGEVLGRRKLSRSGLRRWLANQKPLKVYLEACGGSHDWGRYGRSLGHEVFLIAPQFVKPYRMGEKNDWNDALAVGVAGFQPTMRFVGVKSADQQAIQVLHRVRERVKRDRNALAGQVRGILGEYGIVVGQSLAVLRRRLPEAIGEADNGLPELVRGLLQDLYEELVGIESRLKRYTEQIERLARTDPMARELVKLSGIGPITATAMVSEIADARVFRNGRQMSAYIGLVPRQFTTGGKVRLGPISKRGKVYLRQLLIHGARTVVQHVGDKPDRTSCWIRALVQRRGYNKAVVALANKQVRWAWSVMTQATA